MQSFRISLATTEYLAYFLTISKLIREFPAKQTRGAKKHMYKNKLCSIIRQSRCFVLCDMI